MSAKFFHRYNPNCGKMPDFAMLHFEEYFKKFPDPEVEDYQNLISSSSTTVSSDTSVVKF